jgi:hypothetical protein
MADDGIALTEFPSPINDALLSYQAQYVPAALLGGRRNSLPNFCSFNAAFAVR